MATASTNTTIAGILKRLYTVSFVDKQIVRDRPGLAMAKRSKDFNAQEIHVPIATKNNQNISHTFSVAQGGAAGAGYDKFLVTPVSFYGVGALSGLVVSQAENGGNEAHFVDALKNEFLSVLEQMGQRLAKEYYGNTGGALARIGSVSTTTVQLSVPSLAIYFEKDMLVASATTDGTSGSLTDSGHAVTLASVDLDNGYLVATTSWGTTISGIAAGDYLFAKGDFGIAAAGLESWNPSTAISSSDSFFGFNRSVNAVICAGGRYSATTQNDSIDTCLQRAIKAHYAKVGEKPEYILMNPNDVGRLMATKEGIRNDMTAKSYGLGIEAFSVLGTKIVEDFNCPEGIARAIGSDAFEWHSCGTAPMIDKTDGLEILRAATADEFELRCKAYYNFLSKRPKALFNVQLPTA